MAEHYTQGRRDAFGRRISDEEWDMNERMRAASRQETARRQSVRDQANAPLDWAPYLEGLGSQAASGATLGFSNYIPGFREAGDTFANKYPVSAGVANIAGLLPSLLIAGPERLALRGAEALAPAVTGAAETAARGIGSRLADIVSTPFVNRMADRAASELTSAVPILSRSANVVPTAISSALQGGVTAFNDAREGDPSPISTGLKGMLLGGLLGGAASGAAKYAVPAVGSLLGISGLNESSAIKQVLNSSGISRKDFLNSLSQLPGNARVYDASPVTLGAAGLLRNIANTSSALKNTVRNTATNDISNIINDSQGLTERHLGQTLPGTYNDYIAAANDAKKQATAPLYAAADQIPVDLASHPDLMNHYVVSNDFANFLNKARNSAGVDPATSNQANRFLADRAQAMSAAENAVSGLDPRQIGSDTYNGIYNDALTNHIANNNLDLSVPRPLVSNYIDDLKANEAEFNKQFSRLTPNPVNDATRISNMTSRAMQEISPEYANAQQTFARMSIPESQAVLARTLTKNGGVDKLGSEVTQDFINSNQGLVQRAQAAGLPDNSRPLTRYVLDENINNAVQRNTQTYPKAILDTIDNQVQPRLESIYGQEPVSNLVRDATNNAQLLENRTNLANEGLGNARQDRNWLETLFLHNPIAHTARALISQTINRGQNKAIVTYLQRNPAEGLRAAQEYLASNPGGDLNGYSRYISAFMGPYTGAAADRSVYIPTEADRRREILGY